MTEWHQSGYAVISDVPSVPGMPFTHSFQTTEWEAQRELRAVLALPKRLVSNPRIVPATLSFERKGTL
jgi:hypothetical protein